MYQDVGYIAQLMTDLARTTVMLMGHSPDIDFDA